MDIRIHIQICVDTKYLSLHILVPEILKWPRSLDTVQKGTRCKKITLAIFLATTPDSYRGCTGKDGGLVTISAK